MNKHKYLAYQIVDGNIDHKLPMIHKVGGELSGWIYSDACSHAKCPHCGSEPGFECETKTGRVAWPPHTARQTELIERMPIERFKFKLLQ